MKFTMFFVAALLTIVMVAPTSAQSTDIDLKAADGVTLKATYTSPGRPGPAMLLIHQCNMDRTAWAGMSRQLVDAGVHVLTMDLRGFGDSGGEGMSGGFPNLLAKSAADLDMALAYLVGQTGVDGSRIGVGGASCGAMLTGDLPTRHDGITTLMLLSGPPSETAIAHIATTPSLGVFGAAAENDQVIAGVANVIKGAVDGSKNPRSTATIVGGTEHGLPMFDVNPELEPQLVSWLKTQLLSH
jgi:dienelactone hydrolase